MAFSSIKVCHFDFSGENSNFGSNGLKFSYGYSSGKIGARKVVARIFISDGKNVEMGIERD